MRVGRSTSVRETAKGRCAHGRNRRQETERRTIETESTFAPRYRLLHSTCYRIYFLVRGHTRSSKNPMNSIRSTNSGNSTNYPLPNRSTISPQRHSTIGSLRIPSREVVWEDCLPSLFLFSHSGPQSQSFLSVGISVAISSAIPPGSHRYGCPLKAYQSRGRMQGAAMPTRQ